MRTLGFSLVVGGNISADHEELVPEQRQVRLHQNNHHLLQQELVSWGQFTHILSESQELELVGISQQQPPTRDDFGLQAQELAEVFLEGPPVEGVVLEFEAEDVAEDVDALLEFGGLVDLVVLADGFGHGDGLVDSVQLLQAHGQVAHDFVNHHGSAISSLPLELLQRRSVAATLFSYSFLKKWMWPALA